MKVYHVKGIRRCTVVFSEDSEKAELQAIEKGLIEEWELPNAIEVPLPNGYRIIKDNN